jgi:hypothetical protein
VEPVVVVGTVRPAAPVRTMRREACPSLQLISNTSIEITAAGVVNASGCGGTRGGGANDQGGGGGAGGTLLFEAPRITVAGTVAVNGGGGGGGGNPASNGSAGTATRTQATGGTAGNNGGAGGSGAAGAAFTGMKPAPATNGGGGGGGIGRIRFNTRDMDVVPTGTLSPALDDTGSTATQGKAAVD